MKKLLYISVNSKPEELSASKTVARAFINKFLQQNNNYQLEELDLYNCHLPRLKYQYFDGRNAMIKKDAIEKLSKSQQDEAHHISEITEQFVQADMYVIAAPVWSMSFPAPLKEYLDCVVMDGKTIKLEKNRVIPMLDNKPRQLVYVQSSGAGINMITGLFLDKGVNYVRDLSKLMGIKKFKEFNVDNTGFTEEEKRLAIDKAIMKIDDLIKDLTPQKVKA